MKENLLGCGLLIALGLSPGPGANAADIGNSGSGKALLASAADSMGTVRTEDRMLEGSKYTREASCIPRGGVTRSQIVLATMSYLKQNPQHRSLPAGALLRQALRQAYPCPE